MQTEKHSPSSALWGREGLAGHRNSGEPSAPLGMPWHQAPSPRLPGRSPRQRGQRQFCHCHGVKPPVVLCCLLGQATGTDCDGSSTTFTDGTKEEAAHCGATQHVSKVSVALGTGMAELGTAPLLHHVLWQCPCHPLSLSL